MATNTFCHGDPRDDAMALYRAFKGSGCDTAAVIDILAHRSSAQRPLIQEQFKTIYSEELTKRLSSELSGDVKEAIVLWMPDPPTRDATILRQALCKDKDLKAATEIICSRTPSQLQCLKQIYFTLYGAHVEDDIKSRASGDHKKLLIAYVSKQRSEFLEVDNKMAENDALILYAAGEKKAGTDEMKFVYIFSERRSAQLAAISSLYKRMNDNSLAKAIKNETSGHFEYALLTILRSAENPVKYFAKMLHNAMKGLGTDEKTLTRVIVTRAEIDLQYIKAEYQKKYSKSLKDAVHSETSKHYRKFLLELIGPNP